MSAFANVSGTWKGVPNIYVKIGTAWKSVASGFTKQAGVWRQCFGAMLSASASPSTASGTGTGGSTVTTNSVMVTPSGGLAPYSHSWSYVSGDAAIFPLVTPVTSPIQAWARGTAVGAATYNAVWKDRITDSVGAVFDVNIPITINST